MSGEYVHRSDNKFGFTGNICVLRAINGVDPYPSKRKTPTVYNRNLPHFQPPEGVFFVTFRLHGSLPKQVIRSLQLKREKEISRLSGLGVPQEKMKDELNKLKSLYEGKFDHLLDDPYSGPAFLKHSRIAEIVEGSIYFLAARDFRLICHCIMPNHVHLILDRIQRPLFRILQSLKRHSAREANRQLSRQGPFWQKESYDGLIRNDSDLQIKINYTLNNPVKAGLARHWKDWRFSYLSPEFTCTSDFVSTGPL